MNKILKLKNDGLFSDEIAKELNLDKKEVDIFLVNYYYDTHNKIRTPKSVVLDILEKRYSGISFQEINKILNISSGITTTLLKKIGIKFQNKAYLDKSILTDQNIALIINKFNSGETIRSIAKDFNLNVDIISKLLKSRGIKTSRISFNDSVFDIIDTEEKAYWLGFLYADGCVSSSRNEIEISLQGLDIYHLYKFKLFTNSKNKPILYLEKPFRCRFSLSSNKIKERLIQLGCTPQKSLTLKFPDESIFKDKFLIRHFIRGYFDGDGCLSYTYTNPRISDKITISCSFIGTRDFLEKLNKIFIELGCHGNFYHDRRHSENIWNLDFSKNNSVMLCNYLYDNSSIYLERKYQKYIYFKNSDNFAVYKSNFIDYNQTISEKAKNWILQNKDINITIHANTEINSETKESESS